MDKMFKSGFTNLRKTMTKKQSGNEKKDDNQGLVFGIEKGHLLPDELINKEMTEAQKRRATRAASVQMDQDTSVLQKELDPARLEDGFDPGRMPEDEDVVELWLTKEESELTSELKIIDEQVNKAASRNYNDFLKGIEMIQEIDLDLSRADIFVENARMKLQSGKLNTESGLSISAERRRLSRLISVDNIIDIFRLLIDQEREMNSCIEDNNYVTAVKIATSIKQTLDEFNFAQYTAFGEYIQRINKIFPTLRQQLHEEVLLSFDINTYIDIYRSYLYLDKALASSTEELPSMADRILKTTTEAIQEQALSDLRIYLHDHHDSIKIPEELIDSMGYMALAKETPVSDICPALIYIMNGVSIILHNHYMLTQLHAHYNIYSEEDVEKADSLTLELLHSKSIAQEQEELQQDENTLLRKQLDKSRSSVWHSAQKIVADFINVAKLDNMEMKLSKFHEIYNACQYFIKFGLTFSKTTSNDLNNALRVKGYLYYNIIEKNSLEKIKQALSVETWSNIPSTLEDLGGISSLLSIMNIDKDNMKSEEEIQQQLDGAFTNWLKAGSPITPDTKIPYPTQTLPELGNISASFPAVLTNSLIQGFIRPLGTYLDFMISIPIAADTAFSGITKLIDTYVYSIFNIFTPDETMSYLFSDPDIPPPIYKSLTIYIRRIWLENFPEVDPADFNEDSESSPSRTPISSPGHSPKSPGRTPRFLDTLLDNESDDEDNFPPPLFEVSKEIYDDVYSHIISKRLIAAETCKFIIELMSCIRALVQQLSFSKSGESVVNYFSVLPEIVNDLHILLYRASSKELLEEDDHIDEWVSKTKWEIKSVNTEHSSYVPNVISLLNMVKDNILHLKEAFMPDICVKTFYREIISYVMEDLYIAYSNVKKCSNEGRQQMQLDIDEIWTLASAIHPIEPPIAKDDKYIKKYLKACMFTNEGDFLTWVNDEHDNYSYEDVVSIINNNLAKKLTKQKLKAVTQAVDSIYGVQSQ